MKRLCRLMIIAFILFLPAGSVNAGELVSPASIRFEKFYLDEALVFLADEAGFSRIICGQVRGVITRNAVNTPPSLLLEQLAKENRLLLTMKTDTVIIRTVAKPPASTVVDCSLAKMPLADGLKLLAEAYGLQLAVRGQLPGEVCGEFRGNMKEVLDKLAAKYNFRWSVSRSTLQVTSIQKR